MYAWQSRDRLCPPRMVWLEHNYNEPRYELVKWHQPSLRDPPRLAWGPWRKAKVEDDRDSRQRFPGETGRWPLNRRRRKWRRSRKAS